MCRVALSLWHSTGRQTCRCTLWLRFADIASSPPASCRRAGVAGVAGWQGQVAGAQEGACPFAPLAAQICLRAASTHVQVQILRQRSALYALAQSVEGAAVRFPCVRAACSSCRRLGASALLTSRQCFAARARAHFLGGSSAGAFAWRICPPWLSRRFRAASLRRENTYVNQLRGSFESVMERARDSLVTHLSAPAWPNPLRSFPPGIVRLLCVCRCACVNMRAHRLGPPRRSAGWLPAMTAPGICASGVRRKRGCVPPRLCQLGRSSALVTRLRLWRPAPSITL